MTFHLLYLILLVCFSCRQDIAAATRSNGLAQLITTQELRELHQEAAKQKPNSTFATPAEQKAQENQLEEETEVETEEPFNIVVLDFSEKIAQDKWGLITQLHDCRRNPLIHGILIRLETMRALSLGLASALFLELKETAEKKPIVGLILEDCIGSCYYAAAGTKILIASPLATVGSIGVELSFAKHRNTKLRSDTIHADIKFYVLARGKYKTILDPYTPDITPEEEQYLQNNINELYDQFCKDIADSRGLSMEQAALENWANGHTHFAHKAKKLGLIDQIGNFSTALSVLLDLLKKAGHTTDQRSFNFIYPDLAKDTAKLF